MIVGLSCLAACAPTDVVQLQLASHGGVNEGAEVLFEGAAIGVVTHVRFSRTGGAAVAEIKLHPDAFARLDPDTIWAVRPSEGQGKPHIVASNLCVDHARGIAPKADISGFGGPLHQLLPAIAQRHAACIARQGGGYGPIRALLGAPVGLGAAVTPSQSPAAAADD
jgi:hypothetical protein